MRDVALLGVGQTPVGEHWETSLTELAAEACLAAMNHADLARPYLLVVGNMLAASRVGGQLNLGAKIADWCGLGGLEAYRTEAACGSGAAAFRCGTLAVASGEVDTALVVGAEKMSHASTADLTAALAGAAVFTHLLARA